mgnify:CR=1 FL=1
MPLLDTPGAAPVAPPPADVESPDAPTIRYRPPVPSNVFVQVSPFPMPPPPEPASEGPSGNALGAACPLTDHQGKPLSPQAHLFAAAPLEIGVVRSAATSLARGGDSGMRRLSRALLVALPLAGLARLATDEAVRRLAPPPDVSIEVLRWGAPALVALLVLWLTLPTRRVLTYVGAEGIAMCDVTFRFWPPARPLLAVLTFARVRDLTVDVTHGRGHVSFAYTWHGHDGAVLLRIARRGRATPDGAHPLGAELAELYDFCRAAERSWTLRLVETCKRVLGQPGGALIFPIYASNCSGLRLQDGELVFALASGEARIPASLLSSVPVVDGKVHFTTEEGAISLPCAQVGNLGVLLLVLAHHLGVAVR